MVSSARGPRTHFQLQPAAAAVFQRQHTDWTLAAKNIHSRTGKEESEHYMCSSKLESSLGRLDCGLDRGSS